MVYGFDTPSTYGKFFPEAEMPDYWEHLEQRFNDMSADGATAHEFFSQFKSDFTRDCLHGLQAIDEDLLPKGFVLAKPYKALGDVVLLGLGVAVTARFRELIEKLEPGRHQFRPIKIIQRSGETYSSEYFTLRVLTALDAWDRERSDPGSWKKSVRIAKMRAPLGDHAHGIALSRSVIGDHHIWRGFVSQETGISGFDYYVSDSLKAAIDQAGLKTPPMYQLKEV
ncbi:hypothetical protein DL239_08195 [Sedimentitalea sp. CY04]|uniref:Immunity MXAN-0049 protein domain-containing protein n=1 Tax=Parasedimentitalea denitrificans TaxID=2211118 RepID=A0ABX0W5N2_9RHOB|nr:DUF1629 domain-containing protein [Sedimentitalea sp. CY04]NIZ60953.1 hypothetical protein [Sedimentitalea sp. CY04]